MHVPINCPICGSRLCDADSRIRTETRLYNTKKTNWQRREPPADIYTKCWKCKSCIGIRTMV